MEGALRTSAYRCRSAILLEYFGETDVPPCTRCDICRAQAKREATSDLQDIPPDTRVIDDIPTAILRLLRAGRLPASTVAQVLCIDAAELAANVRTLSDRGLIKAEGLYLELC